MGNPTLISTSPETRRQLIQALDQLETASLALDKLGVPGEVGAMLDLAITRLEATLERDAPPEGAKSLIDRLEQELANLPARTEGPNPWETGPI